MLYRRDNHYYIGDKRVAEHYLSSRDVQLVNSPLGEVDTLVIANDEPELIELFLGLNIRVLRILTDVNSMNSYKIIYRDVMITGAFRYAQILKKTELDQQLYDKVILIKNPAIDNL